ncbi:hypothetical protein L6452_40483 [Arctium lappa]|uniref:Uncharacterized protein n=1 Tax=Arctium lappa TaxID=4217 RepID=A0ACB8XLF5_ARCLA|nr:hypothetical protein L6452_40483 [Arctium lappa]
MEKSYKASLMLNGLVPKKNFQNKKRQIQAQFQTSGKQALQEALRSSLEAFVVPPLEMSCKAMFDQNEVSQTAGRSFQTAFPAQDKRLDARMLCADEMLIQSCP